MYRYAPLLPDEDLSRVENPGGIERGLDRPVRRPALRQACRERLNPYQRVRRIEFVELPKTISGKIRHSRHATGPVQLLARSRLMTRRWIWLVPSNICMTLTSRMYRSTGKSLV